MLPKLAVWAALLGLVAVGWLLFSGHPGAAGRAADWIYFLLIIGMVLGLVGENVKKD